METPEVSGLEERLERLEAEARRARSALGLLALASLAGFITLLVWMETHARERARFATIEARQIIVDPGKGQPTIRLGADFNGISRIVVGSDSGQKAGIGFGMFDGNAQLFVKAGRETLSRANLLGSSIHFEGSTGAADVGSFGLSLRDSGRFGLLRASDLERFTGNRRVP